MNDHEFYKQRAKGRLFAIILFIIVAIGAAWYLFTSDSFQKIAALESSAERIAAQKLSNNFAAPEPLIATGTSTNQNVSKPSAYTLTRLGVIADTNIARAANGNLPPLKENATLDDIAQIRLDDMFAKQYFAHISPASSSALTVAKAVGYAYIALGENLALGNFVGDQGVVTAWMKSPGHRANILDDQYREIGVAVGEGDFQGARTWIAVQVFGRPLSDCPAPDASLNTQIDADQTQAIQMQADLQAEKSQLDAMQPQSGDAYNQAVADYNAKVNAYNALVDKAKSEVVTYNGEVSAYNVCLGPASVSVTTTTSSQ